VRAPGTWNAFAVDLAHVAEWCTRTERLPLPAEPETVAT
jgi:hypothetical protein